MSTEEIKYNLRTLSLIIFTLKMEVIERAYKMNYSNSKICSIMHFEIYHQKHKVSGGIETVFSRPCIFSQSTRPKSAPVSNTALICREEPPNIPSLA